MDQKLVMAHVYGHCDFFKNNFCFGQTNRKMMDEMANHATRVRRYMDALGVEEVEDFIDRCLSLENLIDFQSPFIKRAGPAATRRRRGGRRGPKSPAASRPRSTWSCFINPAGLPRGRSGRSWTRRSASARRSPSEPERDVLLFLLEHAPLERWQRDVLVHRPREAYYFAPQGQTKIMNEGWATYWHSTIMTEKALDASEIIDYADHHSGTLATPPGQLNPYKLGIELSATSRTAGTRAASARSTTSATTTRRAGHWDKKLGLGREKIFEVPQALTT